MEHVQFVEDGDFFKTADKNVVDFDEGQLVLVELLFDPALGHFVVDEVEFEEVDALGVKHVEEVELVAFDLLILAERGVIDNNGLALGAERLPDGFEHLVLAPNVLDGVGAKFLHLIFEKGFLIKVGIHLK